MKAILEFNFPEDKGDHILAVQAVDWYLAVWDLDEWLEDEMGTDGGGALESVRDKLREILRERGLSL